MLRHADIAALWRSGAEPCSSYLLHVTVPTCRVWIETTSCKSWIAAFGFLDSAAEEVDMKRLWVGSLIVTLVQIGFSQATQQNAPPAGGQQSSVAQTVGLFVYPQKQQTPEQQSKDENECFASAKQQTGIDPFAPAASKS
jgi:hypothetical protein